MEYTKLGQYRYYHFQNLCWLYEFRKSWNHA